MLHLSLIDLYNREIWLYVMFRIRVISMRNLILLMAIIVARFAGVLIIEVMNCTLTGEHHLLSEAM